MREEHYIKITEKIRKIKYGEKIFNILDRLLTDAVYIAFMMVVAIMAVQRDIRVIRIVLVCGVSFAIVSMFRHLYDADRPYTIYNFEPIVKKDKKGHSMPSRHVFSAFVIAIAFLYVNQILGIIFLAISVLMAFERVIVGVHFPKDVIAGAVIGIISGVIGFYL